MLYDIPIMRPRLSHYEQWPGHTIHYTVQHLSDIRANPQWLGQAWVVRPITALCQSDHGASALLVYHRKSKMTNSYDQRIHVGNPRRQRASIIYTKHIFVHLR